MCIDMAAEARVIDSHIDKEERSIRPTSCCAHKTHGLQENGVRKRSKPLAIRTSVGLASQIKG